MKDVTTTIRSCARCQETHVELTFAPLLNPQGEWSHWAECPNTREPIMLAVVDDEGTDIERVVKYVEDATNVKAAFILLLGEDRNHTSIYSRGGVGKLGLEEMDRLSEGLGKMSDSFGEQVRAAGHPALNKLTEETN